MPKFSDKETAKRKLMQMPVTDAARDAGIKAGEEVFQKAMQDPVIKEFLGDGEIERQRLARRATGSCTTMGNLTAFAELDVSGRPLGPDTNLRDKIFRLYADYATAFMTAVCSSMNVKNTLSKSGSVSKGR